MMFRLQVVVRKKFAVAISGILWSFRSQCSFWIHLPITAAVIGLAVWLDIEPWRWVAVMLAITIVFCRGTAEHIDRATCPSFASGITTNESAERSTPPPVPCWSHRWERSRSA